MQFKDIKSIQNEPYKIFAINITTGRLIFNSTLKFDIEQQAKNIFGREYFIVMTHNNEGKDDY